MNLIELHILQSFPVSCLNRDDLGSPKSAVFGGVKRARISSQCLKRALRMSFQDLSHEYAQGIRTLLVVPKIQAQLQDTKNTEKDIKTKLIKILKGTDGNTASVENCLLYFSPEEIKIIANLIRKNGSKLPKKVTQKDGADIALFGRMIAGNDDLTIEGAALFSHAISCHRAEPEIDFYTAQDDLKEESGAGMMGVLEFNSACYYRYIGINLDQFKKNLGLGEGSISPLTDDELTTILSAFIRAALTAIPSARKNSMNAATLPSYVLGVRREGQPLQLANAFESPVKSKGEGYVEAAKKALNDELQRMKDTWGYKAEVEAVIPEVNISEFISRLTANL